MTVYSRTRQQIGIPLLGRQIGRVSGVVIHHWTSHYRPDGATVASEVQAMQEIHAFHRGTGRHGGGFGYSAAAFASGRAYEGRGAFRSGAHTIGHNSRLLAIAIPGNTNSVRLTEPQIQCVRDIIGYWVSIGACAPNPTISGHRDWSSTACPGSNAYSVLHRFRGVGGPDPADPDPDTPPDLEDDDMPAIARRRTDGTTWIISGGWRIRCDDLSLRDRLLDRGAVDLGDLSPSALNHWPWNRPGTSTWPQPISDPARAQQLEEAELTGDAS